MSCWLPTTRIGTRSATPARRLSKETETLARAGDRGGWREFLEFNDQELERKVPADTAGRGSLAKRRIAPDKFPYCLATSYFSSSYFGLSQAIEIDSLRFAIDQGPPRKRSYYLAALVQAASQCAAAPGHFAQYLVPRDRRTCRLMSRASARDRSLRASSMRWTPFHGLIVSTGNGIIRSATMRSVC